MKCIVINFGHNHVHSRTALFMAESTNKKRTLPSFFASKKERKKRSPANNTANTLAQRLGADVCYLTPEGESWYLLKRKWLPSENFEAEWNLHPTVRHELKIFGKTVHENRWSQSWGFSYAYSGSTNFAKPLEESEMVTSLIEKANEMAQGVLMHGSPYNGCLQNWYEPDDTIGLHSDDERSLRRDCPIWSLSWGGTRRFLFRQRSDKKVKTEFYLHDGDLLIMGGTCQLTHYHEVPKRRITMDPPTSRRINWTVRAFQTPASVRER
jgi:alkylated DNA repair dioxygenase AlkB